MASGINIYLQLLILTIRTVSPPGFIRQAYAMPLLLSFLFFLWPPYVMGGHYIFSFFFRLEQRDVGLGNDKSILTKFSGMVDMLL